MKDLLPSLIGAIDPRARDHIAAVAELAAAASQIGPAELPEAYQRLFATAEAAHRLPPDVVAACFIELAPSDMARAAGGGPAALGFSTRVHAVARLLSEAVRRDGLAAGLLWAAGELAPGGDVRVLAGRAAGLWQILTARRIDPDAARQMAAAFSTGGK